MQLCIAIIRLRIGIFIGSAVTQRKRRSSESLLALVSQSSQPEQTQINFFNTCCNGLFNGFHGLPTQIGLFGPECQGGKISSLVENNPKKSIDISTTITQNGYKIEIGMNRVVILGTCTRVQILSTCTWKQCTRTWLLSTGTCTRTVSTCIHGTSTSLEPSVFVFSMTLHTTMEFFKSIRLGSMLYCSVLCLCKMCNRLTLPAEIVHCSSLTIGHQYQ